MSGWLSIWRPSRKLPAQSKIKRACDLMRCRGLTGSSLWFGNNIAMAQRNHAGADRRHEQHVFQERHGVSLAFDGALYNGADLRKELVDAVGGHVSTNGTEELLQVGLRAWGFEGLLKRMDGAFSFCLWDAHNQIMFLARDRVGKKPLYYTFADGGIIAASDSKALVALLESRPQVNEGVLPLYLYHGFVPAPYTIFKNIWKLPPANASVIELRNNAPTKTDFQYWRLRHRPDPSISSHEAEQELDALLRRAVARRLPSDNSAGAFLSGGVDSSTVVSYAAELRPGIRTFSVGFKHQSHNELPYARLVAKACDTAHHEEILEVDIMGSLPFVTWNHGEPFADSSSIPSHAVARAAGRHISVVLTGDGGDELLAGYPTARAAWISGFYKKAVDLKTRERMARLGALLISGKPLPSPLNSLWSLLRYGSRPHGVPYLDGDLWRDDLRNKLLLPEIKRKAVISPAGWHAHLSEQLDAPDELSAMLGLDILVRLPNDYLTKVDVAGMAAGLESRSPFLDTNFIDFAARLPRRLLLPWGEPKGLLKCLAAKRVPREVIYRPKAGFSLPLGAWMRSSYRETIESLLLSNRFLERGWFQPAAVRRLLDEHMAETFDHSARIWSLISLETWCRTFVDGSGSAESSQDFREAA